MNKNLGFGFFAFSMAIILTIGLILIYTFHSLSDWSPQSFFSFSTVTSAPTQLTLDLSSPDDNSLVFDSGILVEGQTSPNTQILISDETNDLVIKSNKDGNFSQTLKLSLGLNNLLITVFDNQGNAASERRTIFYSKQTL